jgi:hypothetical protein
LLCGLLVARRDRRFQFYAGAALILAALSFGPAPDPGGLAALWHPYSWLTWLPGFGGLRVPARIYMLAILCLAVAAGIAYTHLRPRVRYPGLLLGVVLAGLAYDGIIAGMPLGFPPGDITLTERNARVLVLPYEDGRQTVFAMYRSMSHRLPVANGYAGFVPSAGDVIEWGLRRRDPTILTELRRGRPLYVIVAPTDQAQTWTTFMNAQDAQFTGIQSGGRVYLMPPAPYRREVRPGVTLDAATRVDGDWMVADLHQARTVRGLELRTHGNLVRLPPDLLIDVSADGTNWQRAFEQRPGGLALLGALDLPRVVPLRVDLQDVVARFVRVNASAFGPRALTIYGG